MPENRTSFAASFLFRAVVGMFLIFMINQVLAAKGIALQIGLNPVTFATSGLFGMPGVALLYAVSFYGGI